MMEEAGTRKQNAAMTEPEKGHEHELLANELKKAGLGRHLTQLTGESEGFGFESLLDLKDLTEDDMQAVAEACVFNLGEQKRWSRLIKNLQEEMPEQEIMEDKQNEEPQRTEEQHQRTEEEAIEWFEVLKSMVFIKVAPTKDAGSRAIVRKGERIQVLSKRILDPDLHEWVEITPSQLNQFPCDENAATGRGFALIDGTHMGLGQLLRGPLPPEQCRHENADKEREQQREQEEEQDEQDTAWDEFVEQRQHWMKEFQLLQKRKEHWSRKNAEVLNTEGNVQVEVFYQDRQGQLPLFQTLISERATVSNLKAQICRNTMLRFRAIILLTVVEPPQHIQEEWRLYSNAALVPKDFLRDEMTLESYKFTTKVQLFLQYTGHFEKDYKNGILFFNRYLFLDQFAVTAGE